MGMEKTMDVVWEVQQILRERIMMHSTPPEIHGYAKERGQLLELVRRTAEIGESNSILVIGPRGCGKTMLMKSILSELEEREHVQTNLLQVHLNGLLQTTDRLALHEITRQLQLENTVGDRVFGSFAENLQFLLDSLKSGGKQSKSILFVLEEFDLFAHHKNQTLLYNLFDVSQSAQALICVVGLTARLDVLELLEKRVKSRFSHRQIYLLPTLASFGDYIHVFTTLLSLPDSFPDKKFCKEWNKTIQALSEEASVQDVLKRQYNVNKDIRALHQLLVLPISSVTPSQPFLTASSFIDSSKLINTDSKAATLHGVSVLELCLIIGMKHLTDTTGGEPFNFEMVFNEYRKFAQRRSSMQMFDRAVVMKAFEHLSGLELIRPVESGTGKVQKEFRLSSLLVESTQLTDALQHYPGCPTEVRQWAVTPLG